METAKDRLLIFLDHIGIGQNAFEKKAGIANGYISHNKGSIGSKVINKISESYPELNTSWLATGVGAMLNKEEVTAPTENVTIPREVFDQITRLTETVLSQQRTIETLADLKGGAKGAKGAAPKAALG